MYKTIVNKLIKYDEKDIRRDGTLILPSIVNGVLITELGGELFSRVNNIKKIVIPKTVKRIFSYAFSESKIEEVVFEYETQIEFIGDGCFANMHSLRRIDFSKSHNKIHFGRDCFRNTSLKKIDFSDLDIGHISDGMFIDSKLQEIKLPTTLKRIGHYAFQHCNDLISINLNELELDTIGIGAFQDANLKNMHINIPSNTKVRGFAFSKTKIKSVTIYTANNNLGDKVFKECENLKKVEFVDSPSYYTIPFECFYNCKLLTDVYIGTGCTQICPKAFYMCNISNIELPKTITHIFAYSFFNNNISNLNLTNLTQLECIEVQAFSKNLLNKDNVKLPLFSNVSICPDAFSNKDLKFEFDELLKTVPFSSMWIPF